MQVLGWESMQMGGPVGSQGRGVLHAVDARGALCGAMCTAGPASVCEIRKSLHRRRGSNPRFGVCNKVMNHHPEVASGACDACKVHGVGSLAHK